MRTLTYKSTRFASYVGYITQAIVNNFSPLLFVIFQNEFNISLAQITLMITFNFGVQLCVDLLAVKFADKAGTRVCAVAAHIFSAVGLAGLSIFPKIFPDPYIGILLAVLFSSAGGGLIEVLVSPIIEACPSDNKAAGMSILHSFYCWGSVLVIVVTTIFLKVFGAGNWHVLAFIWALLPAANAVLFARVPIASLVGDGEKMPLKQLLSNKMFLVFLVMMLSAGAAELSMSQWASVFAEKALGVSKTFGDLAGPCFFAVLMGLSRVFYAKFSEKTTLVRFILGSAVLCVVSYLITVFSPWPWLSLVGCGLCGLAVGIMWPGTISLGSRYFTGGGSMFAVMALFGDIGCTSGPTVVGFVSDTLGGDLKKGLLAATVFPLMIVAAGIYCTRKFSK